MGKGDKYASLAEELMGKLGGASNVADAAHCMTRLRVLPIDRSKVKMEDIKNTEGVLASLKRKRYKSSSGQAW